MKNHFFLSLALGAGWLLSPESLVIAGNTAGQMGMMIIPVLVAVVLLLGVSGTLLQQAKQLNNSSSDILLLGKLTGRVPATCVLLAQSVPLTILAATALLVSCGYTFNEVFLYWFPNFGFSFLLLVLLMLIQFLPEKLLLKLQLAFVLITAAGLLFLSLYGIAAPPAALRPAIPPMGITASSSAILFLLFAASGPSEKKLSPWLIPITGFLLFSLWTIVSIQFVPPHRLASSTIPYMTSARKIMGDPGRQLMGIIVIAGSCAAGTALILNCRRILGSTVSSDSTQTLLSPGKQRWLLPPLLALVSGALMATGLAGDELLEVLLRGALILWFLYYVLLSCAAVLQVKQGTQKIPLAGSFSCLVLLLSLTVLIFTDPHKSTMLLFIISILAAATPVAAGLLLIPTGNHTATTTSAKENTP